MINFYMSGFRMDSEINDVVDIMRNNIDKTMQRGERLDDLQDKSGETKKNNTLNH